MVYGSVCSGIEGASVAWEPLGWKGAWLSEIEPFPNAVLAHRHPNIPNLGDMTRLHETEEFGTLSALSPISSCGLNTRIRDPDHCTAACTRITLVGDACEEENWTRNGGNCCGDSGADGLRQSASSGDECRTRPEPRRGPTHSKSHWRHQPRNHDPSPCCRCLAVDCPDGFGSRRMVFLRLY